MRELTEGKVMEKREANKRNWRISPEDPMSKSSEFKNETVG